AHFRSFGKPVCFLHNDISWIVVIGEDAPRVARTLLGWKTWVKTWFPFVKLPYRAFKSLFEPKKLPPGAR
ncbi:MAG TPA: hypothetical protein VN181_16555, partial [Thermoanaerobaculia bacterium]|nr:hypothetical protein [Thermoanaerobaculia bacterium]